MNFVDRMFLLWESTEAMAAAMPTGVFLFALICFPMGVAGYATTFVAQYEGAGTPEKTGRVVWQAFLLGLLFIPVFLGSIFLAPLLFAWAGHEPAVQQLENQYYRVMALGAGGMVCSVGLSTFFTGRGMTRVVMRVDILACVMNVLLDYCWIFGYAGFPAWGITGAGLATTVCQWSRVAVYLWLLSRRQDDERYGISSGRKWDSALMQRLLRFGAPEGLRMFFEVTAVSLFLILVGRLGTDAMTATTLAFNVNSVAFVPLIGMSTAVSVLVGQQLGKDQVAMARRATRSALSFALLYSGVMGILYLATPDLLMAGHAAGADPEDFGRLRDITVVLLRFVAAFCLCDAIMMVYVGALKGAGDTYFVLLTTMVTSPLLVIVVGCGMFLLDWGLIGCWGALTGWLFLVSLIYAARYHTGAWESMRVFATEEKSSAAESSDEVPFELEAAVES